jgi:Clp amino terminal domain, pathogenicity island component
MRARKPSPGRPLSHPIGAVLTAAHSEAERARHGYVGLEHLLLVLAHPTAPATQRLLEDHGITLDRARDAVWLVIGSGRGDGPRLDSTALLATLGIDLDQIRRQVERQFGSDAIQRLYAGDVGGNLRPRGPLCELPIAPKLKKAISDAVGGCWDDVPPALHPRLLIAALDSESQGLTAVLDELGADPRQLRTAATRALRIAS